MQALKPECLNTCRIIEFPNTMGAITQPPPIHDPQKHGNYSQIVTMIVAVVALILSGITLYLNISSRSADTQAKVSDEHIKNLINEKLGPAIGGVNGSIDQKLQPLVALSEKVSRLDGQVQELATEVHNLAADVRDLANRILRELAPQKSMGASQLQERFDGTSRFVETAFKANIVADPTKVVAAAAQIESVLKNTRLPEATRQAGISAAVHLNGYEAFSLASRAGAKEPAISGIVFSGPHDIPLDKHFYTAIAMRNRQNVRPVYDVRIKDFWQDLQWIPWIHVTFEHAGLIYDGDDLYLSDVTFKDCIFNAVFTGDQKSDAIAKEVTERLRKANNGPPVNILVADGNVFLLP